MRKLLLCGARFLGASWPGSHLTKVILRRAGLHIGPRTDKARQRLPLGFKSYLIRLVHPLETAVCCQARPLLCSQPPYRAVRIGQDRMSEQGVGSSQKDAWAAAKEVLQRPQSGCNLNQEEGWMTG